MPIPLPGQHRFWRRTDKGRVYAFSASAIRDLRGRLAGTLKEVERILCEAEPTALEKTYDIQNRRGVTGFEAIYHVLEHFSMHYGQILYITKLLTDQDLGLYRHLDK